MPSGFDAGYFFAYVRDLSPSCWGGEEGPGEPEQCITQPRQPTALNKTRLPFNQPGVALLLSQSGHLIPPQFTPELLFAADVQEPLPCDDGQAQPTRDNAATESACTLPTPCLFWKDPQQVREIWSKVVDPLFLTKNALLDKNPKAQSEDVVQGPAPPHLRDPLPSGDTWGQTCPGAQPRAKSSTDSSSPLSLPALQVLGGFSRHKVISCLKQLTNLHRNWRALCVSGRSDSSSSGLLSNVLFSPKYNGGRLG